jgi:hypothetical protein
LADYIQPSDNIFTYWRTKQAATATGQPEYYGVNKKPGATTTDTDWLIVKYVYNGDGFQTDSQVKIGAWDNRATLFDI